MSTSLLCVSVSLSLVLDSFVCFIYIEHHRECCCCSVAKSCPTLCDPMDCSTPGFPVLHCLLELAQTHVHRVSDAIQPSHPWSSPSPPAFSPSIRVFSSESALHIRCPKYWSFSFSPSNEHSELISFRIDWFDLLAAQGAQRLSRIFSSTTVQEHQFFFGAEPSLWSNFIANILQYL